MKWVKAWSLEPSWRTSCRETEGLTKKHFHRDSVQCPDLSAEGAIIHRRRGQGVFTATEALRHLVVVVTVIRRQAVVVATVGLSHH